MQRLCGRWVNVAGLIIMCRNATLSRACKPALARARKARKANKATLRAPHTWVGRWIWALAYRRIMRLLPRYLHYTRHGVATRTPTPLPPLCVWLQAVSHYLTFYYAPLLYHYACRVPVAFAYLPHHTIRHLLLRFCCVYLRMHSVVLYRAFVYTHCRVRACAHLPRGSRVHANPPAIRPGSTRSFTVVLPILHRHCWFA